MKKTISLTLALVLALSLAACGKNGNTDSSADVPADANTLLTTVWDSYTDDEKFPAAGGDYENPVEDAPGAVDISDADNLNYMLTLPVEDASKIDGAAALSHMMNAMLQNIWDKHVVVLPGKNTALKVCKYEYRICRIVRNVRMHDKQKSGYSEKPGTYSHFLSRPE